MMKKRIVYCFVTLLLLGIEVAIALFVHDDFVRPYVGDVLVVGVLYFFVRTIVPERIRMLPLFIFLFAVAVEFLQYIHIVERLGVQNNAFLRTLIGGTFDWKDIFCYLVGCAILLIMEVKMHGLGNCDKAD